MSTQTYKNDRIYIHWKIKQNLPSVLKVLGCNDRASWIALSKLRFALDFSLKTLSYSFPIRLKAIASISMSISRVLMTAFVYQSKVSQAIPLILRSLSLQYFSHKLSPILKLNKAFYFARYLILIRSIFLFIFIFTCQWTMLEVNLLYN